jgi:tetratricopeptide (TPR) repeat protein
VDRRRLGRDVEALGERPSVHQRATAHASIGSALEVGYQGHIHLVVGRLAEHFVEAGDHARAVEYLRQVGEQALNRSAFAHATEALFDALAHLERLPADQGRERAELRLRLALGPALVATRGWFGAEVAENYERALAICGMSGPCPESALARYALATVTELRGEYDRTEQLLEPLLSTPSDVERESQELMACSAFHQGKFELSLRLATGVVDAWDGRSESPLLARLAEHPASSCNSWASLAAWCLGRFADSQRFAERAIAIGEQHLYALSTAQVQRAFLHQLRGEPQECREWALAATELAESQGFPMRAIQAQMLLGWAEAIEGSAEGRTRIADALERFRATGARLSEPYFLGILADAALVDDRVEDAIELLDEAVASMARGSRTFFAGPELHRAKARALARHDATAHADDIARHLAAAIDEARALGTPVLELRAVVDALRIVGDTSERSSLRERLGVLVAQLGDTGGVDVDEALAVLAELV